MIFCTHKFKIQEQYNSEGSNLILFETVNTVLHIKHNYNIPFLYSYLLLLCPPKLNWTHYFIYKKRRENIKKEKEGIKYFGKGSNKNNPLHSFPIFKFSLNAFFVEAYNAMQ